MRTSARSRRRSARRWRAVTASLNQAIDGAEALFKAHGITSAATYDTVPMDVEVHVLSSIGRRYLEVLGKLDQLMPLLQTLEIHEVITRAGGRQAARSAEAPGARHRQWRAQLRGRAAPAHERVGFAAKAGRTRERRRPEARTARRAIGRGSAEPFAESESQLAAAASDVPTIRCRSMPMCPRRPGNDPGDAARHTQAAGKCRANSVANGADSLAPAHRMNTVLTGSKSLHRRRRHGASARAGGVAVDTCLLLTEAVRLVMAGRTCDAAYDCHTPQAPSAEAPGVCISFATPRARDARGVSSSAAFPIGLAPT